MAHVAEGYPLYYDAVNEKGLGMAGLNFVGNAVYAEVQDGKNNIAPVSYTHLKKAKLKNIGNYSEPCKL